MTRQHNRKLFYILHPLFLIFFVLPASARHQIMTPNVKSLQVILNNDFTAQPVLTLHSDDVLSISFDELSHNYHRFIYRLEPCDPDWTPTTGLFESDWLEGFNDQPIEDYENSLNTNQLYTHYQMQLPNEQTRLTMSGNYRLYIIDDDADTDSPAAIVELRVLEPIATVGLGISTNTDIDLNHSHQQVSMTVNYGGSMQVTHPDQQLQVFVMQNGREDNMRHGIPPTYTKPRSLQWEHSRALIFDAGNEYHKFEVLDPTHPTMGLDHVEWNADESRFHVYPFIAEQRRNYVYDEDANGAFLLRNSDDIEAHRLSEYVYVHYKLQAQRPYDYARIVVDGRWATESPDTYTMTWDATDQSYNAVILQKLGYYNYQLLMLDLDGTSHPVPEEGSFFQTENRYQAYVYYKGTGERSWRLVGFQEVTFRP
ncbi:MAG: DUF5103 domain-containing protein [Prevotella sp.]|nr:DUF5103 domain-containing protein [Prevotella sp.]